MTRSVCLCYGNCQIRCLQARLRASLTSPPPTQQVGTEFRTSDVNSRVELIDVGCMIVFVYTMFEHVHQNSLWSEPRPMSWSPRLVPSSANLFPGKYNMFRTIQILIPVLITCHVQNCALISRPYPNHRHQVNGYPRWCKGRRLALVAAVCLISWHS